MLSINRLRLLGIAVLTVLLACLPLAGRAWAAEKVTINVIAFAKGFAFPDLFGNGDEETDRLKTFEEEEGIDVVIEWGDEQQVRQKITVDLATQSGNYDVVMADTFEGVQAYGVPGHLEPLDEHLEQHPTKYFDREDIYENFYDAAQIGGKIYALPYYSFGPQFSYRKSIFDRYGLKPPKTTDELVQVLEALKQGFQKDGLDMYPITMRGAPNISTNLDLSGTIWAFGGGWFEGNALTAEDIRANKAKPAFNKPPFADGFKFYTDIVKKYAPPGSATYTWLEQGNAFAQGKAAILMPQGIMWAYAVTTAATEELSKDLVTAPIPVGPSGQRIENIWSYSFGISKYSSHKLEAWKVLSLLVGRDSHKGFADMTQWPTVSYRSVMWSDALKKRYGEETLKIVEESVEQGTARFFPYIPEVSQLHNRIATAASEVISGQKDADTALNELQSWAETFMQDAGYY